MYIRNITMTNFRQFKETVNIELGSHDRKKNVVVIHGENGSGKTTILEAFSWCFYGKRELRNKSNDDEYLLNKVVFSNLDIGEEKNVSVAVEFEHENKFFRIERDCNVEKINEKEEKRKHDKLRMHKRDVDGEFKPISEDSLDIKNIIDNIFPKQLSEYFFFDGERMTKIAKNNYQGKKYLSESVTRILGIERLVKMIDLLEDVKKNLASELNYSDQEKLENIETEIEKANAEINRQKEIISNYKADKENFEKQEEEATKLLANRKEDQEIINKINSLEKLLSEEIGKKECIYHDFSIENNKVYRGILGKQLIESSIQILKKQYETEESDEILIELKTLKKILKSKKCVCGNRIVEGSESERHLLKLEEYLEQNKASLLAEELIERFEAEYAEMGLEIKDVSEKYKEKLFEIENIEDEIKKLKRNSSSEKKAEIDKAFSIVKSCNENIKEIDEKLEKDVMKRAKLVERKESLENKKMQLVSQNEKNRNIQQRIKLVEELVETAQKLKMRSEKSAKNTIEESFAEIFNDILSKNYSASLDSDYKIKIKDSKNLEVNPSEGEMQIASICFISSIVKLMRDPKRSEKLRMNYGYLESEDYPLVMDSPFGQLDSAHRCNLSSKLLELSPQIIILVSSSQWRNGVEESVKDSIGFEYELEYQGKKKGIYSEHTIIKGGAFND